MQLHETVPQTMLPLMPLLRDELEVEGAAQRGGAVDLLACLLTQHSGAAALLDENEALLTSLLKRSCDTEVRAPLLACLL